jgi:hypothetical protein
VGRLYRQGGKEGRCVSAGLSRALLLQMFDSLKASRSVLTP